MESKGTRSFFFSWRNTGGKSLERRWPPFHPSVCVTKLPASPRIWWSVTWWRWWGERNGGREIRGGMMAFFWRGLTHLEFNNWILDDIGWMMMNIGEDWWWGLMVANWWAMTAVTYECRFLIADWWLLIWLPIADWCLMDDDGWRMMDDGWRMMEDGRRTTTDDDWRRGWRWWRWWWWWWWWWWCWCCSSTLTYSYHWLSSGWLIVQCISWHTRLIPWHVCEHLKWGIQKGP